MSSSRHTKSSRDRQGSTRSAEQADGIFPVVVRVETKLVQDHLLRFPVGATVALIDSPEVFPFPLLTHRNPLDLGPEWVTFSMERVLHLKWLDGPLTGYI